MRRTVRLGAGVRVSGQDALSGQNALCAHECLGSGFRCVEGRGAAYRAGMGSEAAQGGGVKLRKVACGAAARRVSSESSRDFERELRWRCSKVRLAASGRAAISSTWW